MLLKCFHSKDHSLPYTLFSVFGRPILPRNSPIWLPYFAYDIFVIEHMQKYFIMNEKSLYHKPYKRGYPFFSFLLLDIAIYAYSDLNFLKKTNHSFSNSSLQSIFLPVFLNLALF